jgi:hypothetical protein
MLGVAAAYASRSAILTAGPSSMGASVIVAVTSAGLALLGRLGAATAGAVWLRPTVRVFAGSALAMAVTSATAFLDPYRGGVRMPSART